MVTNICYELEKLSKSSSYPAGSFIFFQGDKAEIFYYLKKGEIQGIVTLADGRQRSVRTNWSGTFFGIPSVLKYAVRPMSAVAIRECEIIAIDRAIYKHCQDAIPGFMDAIVDSLSSEIEFLFERLSAEGLLDSNINVARFICRRVELGEYIINKDKQMLLCYTQDYIANTMSLSRLTINNVLRDFQQRGWINKGYGKLEILDYEAIKRFAYAVK